MSIKTRNLSEGFSSFSDHWSPKICGTVNDMHLKLVKVQGDFNWHHHVDEDELFLVMKGVLRVKLRDPEERTEVVKAGEFIIIPKGIEVGSSSCIARTLFSTPDTKTIPLLLSSLALPLCGRRVRNHSHGTQGHLEHRKRRL